jgi:hypothetical protein
MSSFSKVKRELAEQAPTDRLPCMVCRTTTLKETLTLYGARCFNCYTSYCHSAPRCPDVGDKRIDGPRGWAHALKRRHEQGDRLTPAQVSAY